MNNIPKKPMFRKGLSTTFTNPETEQDYLQHEWQHIRRVYAAAGLVLYVFTVFIISSLTFITYKPVDSPLLSILVATLFLLHFSLMNLWNKEPRPKYVDHLMSFLALTMGATYVIAVDYLTDPYHETLITISLLSSLGLIFLSNGHVLHILFNLIILVAPINFVTALYHENSSLWLTIPVYAGLISFLVYFDKSRRLTSRLNWHRRQAMSELNKEMAKVVSDALEAKARVEETAQQNIHLMEEVYFAKDETEKRNQFLNGLLEGIPLGIAVLDAKSTVTALNMKTLELLNLKGKKKKSYIGKSLKVIIDDLRRKEGGHSPRFWASYDEIIQQKINPQEGQIAPVIKSDFKMKSGMFLSFNEFPLSGGENILITQDITYRKEIEATMRKQALTDSLTGLANRLAFILRFDEAIERNTRNKTGLGLAMIDLDKFKPINDTHGHPIGDKVLRHVGEMLREQVRGVDLCCRLGGDEFAVLFTDIAEDKPPTIACQRILKALNKRIQIEDLELDLGASIGLTFSNSSDINPDQLIDEADKALYRAKGNGRGMMEIVQTTL